MGLEPMPTKLKALRSVTYATSTNDFLIVLKYDEGPKNHIKFYIMGTYMNIF